MALADRSCASREGRRRESRWVSPSEWQHIAAPNAVQSLCLVSTKLGISFLGLQQMLFVCIWVLECLNELVSNYSKVLVHPAPLSPSQWSLLPLFIEWISLCLEEFVLVHIPAHLCCLPLIHSIIIISDKKNTTEDSHYRIMMCARVQENWWRSTWCSY